MHKRTFKTGIIIPFIHLCSLNFTLNSFAQTNKCNPILLPAPPNLREILWKAERSQNRINLFEFQRLNSDQQIWLYQNSPTREIQIHILQLNPNLFPNSSEAIRKHALERVNMELELSFPDFHSPIGLRTLGDYGNSQDIDLLNQVIRSGRTKATHAAMMAKEKLSAKIEVRAPKIQEILSTSPITKILISMLRNPIHNEKIIDEFFKIYDPFLSEEERKLLQAEIVQFSKEEILFVLYGLENDSYFFAVPKSKNSLTRIYLQHLGKYGQKSELQFLEKFMRAVEPQLKKFDYMENILRNEIHIQTAFLANQIRERLKMPHINYAETNQGN